MKKINLKEINLSSEQQLNRKQLKDIFGGGQIIFSTSNDQTCLVLYTCPESLSENFYVQGRFCNEVFAKAQSICNGLPQPEINKYLSKGEMWWEKL